MMIQEKITNEIDGAREKQRSSHKNSLKKSFKSPISATIQNVTKIDKDEFIRQKFVGQYYQLLLFKTKKKKKSYSCDLLYNYNIKDTKFCSPFSTNKCEVL